MKSFLLTLALGFSLVGMMVSMHANDLAFALSFCVGAVLIIILMIDHNSDNNSGDQP